MHDWSRIEAGVYHDFRAGFVVDLRRALNNGLLPAGHSARIDLPDDMPEARKANRISVRFGRDRVVAIIEVVSPGNKHSELAVQAFTRKLAEFVQNGVHVLLIDPFPPGPRDPDGLHQLVWQAGVSPVPIGRRPDDLPLTVAAFDVDEDITAYVEPFAVGDRLPDAPLFLEPGWYVTVPLEAVYQASWDVLPAETKDLFPSP